MTKGQALAELVPKALVAFRDFLDAADKEGIKYSITEARRTLETQLCYFMGGRGMSTADINACRKAVGLYLWTDRENRKITWTLDSNHLSGKAMDIVPAKGYDDIETYKKLAAIADKYNIEWGGNWPDHKDTPHFQFKE